MRATAPANGWWRKMRNGENMRGSIRLEPMTVGMILDDTVRVYLEHRWTLIGIMAVAYIPQLLLWILGAVGDRLGEEWTLAVALLTGFGWLAWWAALGPFAMGAAAHALGGACLGFPPATGRSVRAALRRFGRLLLTSMAVGLVVLFGFMLLIVPGVLCWLMLSLALPVVMLEDAGMGRAISRSMHLTSDHRGRILAVLTIIVSFQMTFQFGAIAVMALFGMNIQSMPSQIVQTISGMFLAPLSLVATVLLYYDLRIRKEGFDLELLSAAPPPGGGDAETQR